MNKIQKIKSLLSNSIVLYGSCGISMISSILLLSFNIVDDCSNSLSINVQSTNSTRDAQQELTIDEELTLTDQFCQNIDVKTVKMVVNIIAILWGCILTVIGYVIKTRLENASVENDQLKDEIVSLSSQVTARSVTGAPKGVAMVPINMSSIERSAAYNAYTYNAPDTCATGVDVVVQNRSIIPVTPSDTCASRDEYEPSFATSVSQMSTKYPSPMEIV